MRKRKKKREIRERARAREIVGWRESDRERVEERKGDGRIEKSRKTKHIALL